MHGHHPGTYIHTVPPLGDSGGGEALEILEQYFADTSEWTGFVNRTDSEFTWDDGLRTFTIQPTGADYVVWLRGARTVKSVPETIDLTAVIAEGLWFIYFDGATGALTATPTFTASLITSHALIAILYWDATSSVAIYLADERHGMVMDGETHLHFHEAFGTRWINGLGLSNVSPDGTGNNDTDAQFAVEDGAIRDEDIQINITDDAPQDLAPIARIPVYYRTGATGLWRRRLADAFPLLYNGDGVWVGPNGRVPYNEFTGATWQLTEVAQSDFVLVHYWASNDVQTPIIAIMGQAQYGNRNDARDAAEVELRNLILGGLPFAEFTPIASVIYQTRSTYTNTPAARVVSVDADRDYISWVGSGFSPASAPVIVQSQYPPQHIEALELLYLNASQVQIQPGSARDGTDTVNLDLPSAVVADITVAGAGGLDAGAEAASTWYYVYLIYDDATPQYAALLSTSPIAPALPAGYQWARRVGTVYNNAASDFRAFVQMGDDRRRTVMYDEDVSLVPALVGGTATAPAWGLVSLAGFVPATSLHALLGVNNQTLNPAAYANIRPTTLPLSSGIWAVPPQPTNQLGLQKSHNFPLLGAVAVEYQFVAAPGASGLSIVVGGYEEQL